MQLLNGPLWAWLATFLQTEEERSFKFSFRIFWHLTLQSARARKGRSKIWATTRSFILNNGGANEALTALTRERDDFFCVASFWLRLGLKLNFKLSSFSLLVLRNTTFQAFSNQLLPQWRYRFQTALPWHWSGQSKMEHFSMVCLGTRLRQRIFLLLTTMTS